MAPHTPDLARHAWPSTRWLAITAVGLAALVAGLGMLWSHTPGQSAWLPPCLFNSLTGFLCTGCGITRAAHALAHGNLSQAMAMNPLAVLALPAAALVWANEGLRRPAWLERKVAILRDARLWAGVVLAFTVARNIPGIEFLGP